MEGLRAAHAAHEVADVLFWSCLARATHVIGTDEGGSGDDLAGHVWPDTVVVVLVGAL